jgi:MFS transporter, FHS family, L-fucose permease
MNASADHIPREAPFRLFGLMTGIFLGGGLLNSVEALLVPRLKLLLGLDYAEALLIQLVYYAGYLVLAVPAALLVAWLGAMRAIAAGLTVMAAGCFAVALAQATLGFVAMLGALLLLSSGVTILQIAGNGAMATYGERDRAASRFTLLQGFNSLGTVIGPLIGAWFLLGQGRGGALVPFFGLGIGFALLGFGFAINRHLLPDEADHAVPGVADILRLLARPHILAGAGAIFAYVGAEVALGTLAVNYLMLPDRLALSPLAAGRLVSLYWAGAMVGRFAGAWMLRRVAAPTLLAFACMGAVLLVVVAITRHDLAGAAALLAVGLCNSIMFPTIYALAMPSRPRDVPAVSMLLCMAVVGGAAVPLLTGLVADRTTLAVSLSVPALCYVVILLFARSRRTAATQEFA